MTEELSPKEFDDQRRDARKYVLSKFDNVEEFKTRKFTTPEGLSVNKARWQGLLDFVENDLYNIMFSQRIHAPEIEDFDMNTEEGRETYNTLLNAYNSYIKEMDRAELMLDAFSRVRATGKLDNAEGFLSLFRIIIGLQQEFLDYFTKPNAD